MNNQLKYFLAQKSLSKSSIIFMMGLLILTFQDCAKARVINSSALPIFKAAQIFCF